MEIQTAAKKLKDRFGSHTAAAKELGVDARTYRRWRSTGRNLPGYAEKLIEVLVAQNGNEASGSSVH
jgi:DNA-binding transcriptional regulator YiaG